MPWTKDVRLAEGRGVRAERFSYRLFTDDTSGAFQGGENGVDKTAGYQ